MTDAAPPIRRLVCPRCGELCKAAYQDVQEGGVGLRDVFAAKGLWATLSAAVSLVVQNGIEPHNALCGKPCGEPMYDGISRCRGEACVECRAIKARRGTP